MPFFAGLAWDSAVSRLYLGCISAASRLHTVQARQRVEAALRDLPPDVRAQRIQMHELPLQPAACSLQPDA